MKRNLTAILITLIITLISGCQDKQIDPNADKREKLQAHKVYQLNTELDQKKAEIKAQSQQIDNLQAELQKKNKLYEDCMNQQGQQFMEMINPIMDELDAVKKENQQLKMQIQQLKENKS